MSTALELVSWPGPWSWCNKTFGNLLDHRVPIFLAHIWCVAGLNTKEMIYIQHHRSGLTRKKKRKQKKKRNLVISNSSAFVISLLSGLVVEHFKTVLTQGMYKAPLCWTARWGTAELGSVHQSSWRRGFDRGRQQVSLALWFSRHDFGYVTWLLWQLA